MNEKDLIGGMILKLAEYDTEGRYTEMMGELLGKFNERPELMDKVRSNQQVPINQMANIAVSDGYNHMYFDDNGFRCIKTKQNASYSYDEFVYWDDGTGDGDPRKKGVKGCSAAYSDRLYRWNPDLYTELCQKHFKHSGHSHKNLKIFQEFMRDLVGNSSLRLTRILEGCNVSSGYPYWVYKWVIEDETAVIKRPLTFVEIFTDK